MIIKYRKKPVVIEAVKWDGTNQDEIKSFAGDSFLLSDGDFMFIKSIEGVMKTGIGSYIVKGVGGEFYPVYGKIFEETYEKA